MEMGKKIYLEPLKSVLGRSISHYWKADDKIKICIFETALRNGCLSNGWITTKIHLLWRFNLVKFRDGNLWLHRKSFWLQIFTVTWINSNLKKPPKNFQSIYFCRALLVESFLLIAQCTWMSLVTWSVT